MAWVLYEDPRCGFLTPLPFDVPDTGDAMLDAPGDRTSVLLRFHQSLELPKREPIRWQVEPDETYTGDDLKRWIQWHIWLKYWVWIERTCG